MRFSGCLVCGSLKDVETSFSKYGAPEYDRPLPPAASRLVIVPSFGQEDEEKSHVRRCPSCATLYGYRLTYEYHVNGSEDEETLSRMTEAEAAAFHRRRARRLEAARQEIDRLESEAGALGDFIDRGHPSPVEADRAFTRMQAARGEADRVRGILQAQVEVCRRICPEILSTWAGAHARICRDVLADLEAAPPRPGFDLATARYVARATLESWEVLPVAGETFISIHGAFLEGYLERLRVELRGPET